MTEREKAQKGYLYDANYDPEIIEEETRCADLCYEFNQCRPSDTKKQKELHQKLQWRNLNNFLKKSKVI